MSVGRLLLDTDREWSCQYRVSGCSRERGRRSAAVRQLSPPQGLACAWVVMDRNMGRVAVGLVPTVHTGPLTRVWLAAAAEEEPEGVAAEVAQTAEEAPVGYAAQGIWPPPHCKLKVRLSVVCERGGRHRMDG